MMNDAMLNDAMKDAMKDDANDPVMIDLFSEIALPNTEWFRALERECEPEEVAELVADVLSDVKMLNEVIPSILPPRLARMAVVEGSLLDAETQIETFLLIDQYSVYIDGDRLRLMMQDCPSEAPLLMTIWVLYRRIVSLCYMALATSAPAFPEIPVVNRDGIVPVRSVLTAAYRSYAARQREHVEDIRSVITHPMLLDYLNDLDTGHRANRDELRRLLTEEHNRGVV